jgi:hypothetical protein
MEISAKPWSKNLKRRYHLENQDTDERKIHEKLLERAKENLPTLQEYKNF